MRIVLDTNVIISALIFGGLPEQVLLNVLSRHELVLSPYIIAETTRILDIRFKVQSNNIKLLQQILNEGEVVYFDPFLNIISDEPDNRIIETAVIGNANYLVTGDKLLLGLKKYKNIKFITVKAFMDSIIKSQSKNT